jgi:hypothetical protein
MRGSASAATAGQPGKRAIVTPILGRDLRRRYVRDHRPGARSQRLAPGLNIRGGFAVSPV